MRSISDVRSPPSGRWHAKYLRRPPRFFLNSEHTAMTSPHTFEKYFSMSDAEILPLFFRTVRRRYGRIIHAMILFFLKNSAHPSHPGALPVFLYCAFDLMTPAAFQCTDKIPFFILELAFCIFLSSKPLSTRTAVSVRDHDNRYIHKGSDY